MSGRLRRGCTFAAPAALLVTLTSCAAFASRPLSDAAGQPGASVPASAHALPTLPSIVPTLPSAPASTSSTAPEQPGQPTTSDTGSDPSQQITSPRDTSLTRIEVTIDSQAAWTNLSLAGA